MIGRGSHSREFFTQAEIVEATDEAFGNAEIAASYAFRADPEYLEDRFNMPGEMAAEFGEKAVALLLKKYPGAEAGLNIHFSADGFGIDVPYTVFRAYKNK